MTQRRTPFIPRHPHVPEPPVSQPLLMQKDEQTSLTNRNRQADSSRLYDCLSPLALLLLAHFRQRRPCRKLSEQEAFKAYTPRQIGNVVQALHRVGLLDQQGQTSGSQFIITPAGWLLLEQFLNQQPIPASPQTGSPSAGDDDTLPVLVLRLLHHFRELRPCWQLSQRSDFRPYKHREVSKCLQALTSIGLVAKQSRTSGSRFITTPVGRMLYERYRDVLPPELLLAQPFVSQALQPP